MPLLLALETATDSGGVALLDFDAASGESELVAEERVDTGQRHAATLLLALDRALTGSGRKLTDVADLALSIGPGSFTGLRIGLATALGLCFGTPRRIAPVSTLAALSLGGVGAETAVPMLDARREQVYAGLYGPGAEARAPDAAWFPPELARRLPQGPLLLLGPGAVRYREAFESALGARASFLSSSHGAPRAAWVGELGARLLAGGLALPPERVELVYLRAGA